jgi:cytochrome oxidase Cu insertion factor (SCO1/SenC/PrrC family)
MTVPASDAARTRRGRLMLIALFVLFFGSAFGAGILRFTGWMPAGLKNHGQLLQPPVDLRATPLQLADGRAYEWNPGARIWRILAAPPATCAADCDALLVELDKVWQLFGHNADQVEILWLGALPADAPALSELRVLRDDADLRARLPDAADPAGVPVYVIDPNGFVILRYPPHADPAGLRADVAKLLKLK